MNFAICIPAYHAHLKYLPEVLESISNQTIKPYLISISVSSIPINTELTIPKTLSNISILVSHTHEQKFSAANRNVAARQALQDPHVEGLVFFDIDDYMHPLYLEKVQQAFEDGADVFLHNYYNWPGRRKPAKEACQEIQIAQPTLYQSYFKDEFKPVGYGQITPFDENNVCIDTHNGHVSLKRFVFEREQFDEDIHFRRTEDCHYNYRLLKAGYTILASSDKLSLYFW
jgi:glycosyltransferase involved in cell wall biosynthesis